jgi:hypothetical protein
MSLGSSNRQRGYLDAEAVLDSITWCHRDLHLILMTYGGYGIKADLPAYKSRRESCQKLFVPLPSSCPGSAGKKANTNENRFSLYIDFLGLVRS